MQPEHLKFGFLESKYQEVTLLYFYVLKYLSKYFFSSRKRFHVSSIPWPLPSCYSFVLCSLEPSRKMPPINLVSRTNAINHQTNYNKPDFQTHFLRTDEGEIWSGLDYQQSSYEPEPD
jgi:hypothetical protein